MGELSATLEVKESGNSEFCGLAEPISRFEGVVELLRVGVPVERSVSAGRGLVLPFPGGVLVCVESFSGWPSSVGSGLGGSAVDSSAGSEGSRAKVGEVDLSRGPPGSGEGPAFPVTSTFDVLGEGEMDPVARATAAVGVLVGVSRGSPVVSEASVGVTATRSGAGVPREVSARSEPGLRSRVPSGLRGNWPAAVPVGRVGLAGEGVADSGVGTVSASTRPASWAVSEGRTTGLSRVSGAAALELLEFAGFNEARGLAVSREPTVSRSPVSHRRRLSRSVTACGCGRPTGWGIACQALRARRATSICWSRPARVTRAARVGVAPHSC